MKPKRSEPRFPVTQYECPKHGISNGVPVRLAYLATDKAPAIARSYCAHCIFEVLDKAGVREVKEISAKANK